MARLGVGYQPGDKKNFKTDITENERAHKKTHPLLLSLPGMSASKIQDLMTLKLIYTLTERHCVVETVNAMWEQSSNV